MNCQIGRSGFPLVAAKVGEATMSTPLRHAKHVDPALLYAPPRVRQRDHVPTEPSAPAVNSDRGSAPLESRADQAIIRAGRQLALDPGWLPEPPQSQYAGRFYRKIAPPAVGILGLAAVIAWIVVSIPSVRLLFKSDVVRAGLLETSVPTDLIEPFTKTRLSNEQGGVPAKVAQVSGNPEEPRSRSDPSELSVSTSVV